MLCEISPQAELDLIEIGDYIARDNPVRAESFVDDLVAHAQVIARSPNAYIARDDLTPGLRACAHQRYMLFFTVGESSIRIERILHSARLISDDDFGIED